MLEKRKISELGSIRWKEEDNSPNETSSPTQDGRVEEPRVPPSEPGRRRELAVVDQDPAQVGELLNKNRVLTVGREEDGEELPAPEADDGRGFSKGELLLDDFGRDVERVEERRWGAAGRPRLGLANVDADEGLGCRAEEGRDELVREAVDVATEPEVLPDVHPNGVVGRELVDRVRVVDLALDELGRRDVLERLEAQELVVGEGRRVRDRAVVLVRRPSEPLRLRLRLEDLDGGECHGGLGARGDRELAGGRPEVGFDVVAVERALVPPPPARQLLGLRLGRIGRLDTLPFDHADFGFEGPLLEVEESAEQDVAAVLARGLEFGSAGNVGRQPPPSGRESQGKVTGRRLDQVVDQGEQA